MQRIGIYSGTFDPIHPGHIAFALRAAEQCNLTQVVFLPERIPREKTNVTDLVHRTALIRHATQGVPQLKIAQLATDQFTVAHTLPELQQRYPDTQLTLLVGSDVVRTFSYRWDGLQQLLSTVSLAIGLRGSDNRQEMEQIIQNLEQTFHQPISHTYVTTTQAYTASTQFRAKPAATTQLHPKAQAYIRKHGLYQ